MKEVSVKTNIMCGSCIEKVTPTLNEAFGNGNWNVDTQHPKKILKVSKEDVSTSDVIAAVARAGYKAEEVE